MNYDNNDNDDHWQQWQWSMIAMDYNRLQYTIKKNCMLEPKRKEQGSQFFETYRACVLTLRNALEWPVLWVQLDLSLKGLAESTYGDIFPSKTFLAQRNAPRLGSILNL